MSSQPMFTREREREISQGFANDKEAHALLDLINAEFTSDPMSVQCFDLRVVERVRLCVGFYKQQRERGL